MDKPKIEIKKENRGKFTEYCNNKGYKSVTTECIEEGLAAKSIAIRKMANFARNSRKWQH